MADSKRLFDEIGPELSEEAKVKKLKAGVRRAEKAGVEALSREDEATVRGYLADPSPAVREEAIDVLADLAEVTWEDFQAWSLDPDEDVRSKARFLGPESGASESEKERYVGLLADSWIAYPSDGGVSVTLTMQGMHEEGWLEPTWRAAETLLDVGNDEIAMSLQCGYFESVIEHFSMGPDDPYIRPWIVGTDKTRKHILLEIANWLQMREDNLCAIVKALAEDADPEIANCSRQMLEWKAAQPS